MRSSALIAWAAATLATASLQPREDFSNADDPDGQVLYVTAPACDYYQCHVNWARGETVTVNWIGPTQGDVSIQLVSNIGGKTYDIVDSIPAFSQTGYCDAGYGVGVAVPKTPCGMVEFEVPQGWAINVNYTVAVCSTTKGQTDTCGYTDNVDIVAGTGGPSGTAVTLLTIDGEVTSTAKTTGTYTGKLPADTAITGAGAATSKSKASSGKKSSSAKETKTSASSAKSNKSKPSSTLRTVASVVASASATATTTASAQASAATPVASSAVSAASSVASLAASSATSATTKASSVVSSASSAVSSSASSAAAAASTSATTSASGSLVAKTGLALFALAAGVAALF